MPDFSDLEREAKEHSQQVDEGLDKVGEEADKLAGGRDHGLIDKGVQEGEKELGGGEQGDRPSP